MQRYFTLPAASHSRVDCPVSPAPRCLDILFPPSLSLTYIAPITPAGTAIAKRPACAGLRAEMDLLMYPLSVLISQECDQVHIDDVASDDNGQDLR